MNPSLLAQALRQAADALEATMPEVNDQGERMLKYSEVADRLGVDESTARRLGAAGEWPEARIGVSVRIRAADLNDYIRRRPVRSRRIA